MHLTETMARFIAQTDYESIPGAVREKTRLSILDTLGVMVPPSSLDQTCERLAELVVEESGPGRSTLIGLGRKGSAVMAAYLNGSFTHVLDYDDTIDDLGHHPSSQTVPAALAVAERVGGVSGRELIAAVALGSDLGARLSSSPTGRLGVDHRWFPISNFGVFSATAAAGKILRLSEGQMVNALGLALHRCHGQLDAVAAPESELRAIRDGFINKEGVLCALMAERDVKACRNGIELFFENYYDNRFDAERLLSGLGEEYRHAGVSLKPWPCCRLTHGYVEATRAILAENSLAPADIARITLVVSPGTRDLFCEPEGRQEGAEPQHSGQVLAFLHGRRGGDQNAADRGFPAREPAQPGCAVRHRSRAISRQRRTRPRRRDLTGYRRVADDGRALPLLPGRRRLRASGKPDVGRRRHRKVQGLPPVRQARHTGSAGRPAGRHTAASRNRSGFERSLRSAALIGRVFRSGHPVSTHCRRRAGQCLAWAAPLAAASMSPLTVRLAQQNVKPQTSAVLPMMPSME